MPATTRSAKTTPTKRRAGRPASKSTVAKKQKFEESRAKEPTIISTGKYIRKELKIVLERCDRFIPPPSPSCVSVEIPHLEISNEELPSPLSSVASTPPRLFRVSDPPEDVERPASSRAVPESSSRYGNLRGKNVQNVTDANRLMSTVEILEKNVEPSAGESRIQIQSESDNIRNHDVDVRDILQVSGVHAVDDIYYGHYLHHEENDDQFIEHILSDDHQLMGFRFPESANELRLSQDMLRIHEETNEDHQQGTSVVDLDQNINLEDALELEELIPGNDSRTESLAQASLRAVSQPVFNETENILETRNNGRPVEAPLKDVSKKTSSTSSRSRVLPIIVFSKAPAHSIIQPTISTILEAEEETDLDEEEGLRHNNEDDNPSALPPPPASPEPPPQAIANELLAQEMANVSLAAASSRSSVVIAPILNEISNSDGKHGREGDPNFFSDFNHTELKESVSSVLNGPSVPLAETMWHCCVLWDSKVLKEFRAHEELKNQLYTSLNIGKLLSECLLDEGHSWPAVKQMCWKKPFILLEVITGTFGKCGAQSSLRVQEVSGAESISKNRPPRFWDLVIFPECQNLANEMVRLYSSSTKTTVILWGAHKIPYPKQWEGIQGELLLMPTNRDTDVLSALIFHHEELTKERARAIHAGPVQESELWNGFQNPDLGYRTLIQVVMDRHPTHLSVYAQKEYKSKTEETEESSGAYVFKPSSPIYHIPDSDPLLGGEIGDDFVSSHSDSNNNSSASMDEEDWVEYLHESRQSSPKRPAVISAVDIAAANRDMKKLAERMFKRAHYVHTSLQPNAMQEETVSGGLAQSQVETDGGSSSAVNQVTVTASNVNGNEDANNEVHEAPVIIAEINESEHAQNMDSQGMNFEDCRTAQDKEDIGGEQESERVSETQKQLLVTQEMEFSENELDTSQHQQADVDNHVEGSFVNLNGPHPSDNVSKKTCQSPISAPNGVMIQWGKGSKNIAPNQQDELSRRNSACDQIQGNVNGNGNYGIGVRTRSTTKSKSPSPVRSKNKSSTKQQEMASYSETSEQYKMSQLFDEL